MAKRKGKIQSINFEDEAYEILTNEVKAVGGNYSSNINRLIYYALALDISVKEEMAIHAYQRALEVKKEANEESGFSKSLLLRQSEQYMDLVSLFTAEKGIVNPEFANMQRIDMKNGYLVCPDDWIQLEICNPAKAIDAVVIEFMNGKKFNLPHFVFLVDRPLNEHMERDALGLAAQVSKEYKKVSLMYQDPRYAKDGRMLNAKEFKEQPVPGFFIIPKIGTTNDYPYGAMVIEQSKGEY